MMNRGKSSTNAGCNSVPRLACIFLFVGLGVICVATLFHLIGMSTPYWVRYSDGGEHYGLFERCGDKQIQLKGEAYPRTIKACMDIDPDQITMKQTAAQVFAFLTLFAGLISGGVIIGLVALLYLSRRPATRKCLVIITLVATIACVTAFICGLTLIGIFVDRLYVKRSYTGSNSNGGKYNYSFALCVVAAFLYPVAAPFFILASRKISTRGGNNANNAATTTTTEEVTSPVEESADMLKAGEMSELKASMEEACE